MVSKGRYWERFVVVVVVVEIKVGREVYAELERTKKEK